MKRVSQTYSDLKTLVLSLEADVKMHEENLINLKNPRDRSMAISRISNTKQTIIKAYDSMLEWERTMGDATESVISLVNSAWVSVVKKKFSVGDMDLEVILNEVIDIVNATEKSSK